MSCDPWPISWPCDEPPAASSEAQQAIAAAAAQEILWGLTGRRLGTCTVVERFAARRRDCLTPRDGRCCEMRLPSRPVDHVVSVSIEGVELDSSAWRLGSGGMLRRVDGLCWPSASLCSETTPIEVVYSWGVRLVPLDAEVDPLPPFASLAAVAMGEMAVELLSGMCGGECKLPSRLSSLTRQGVSIEFLPPGDFIEAGLTGLPLCDAFIRTVNPGRLTRPSRVHSLDTARRL